MLCGGRHADRSVGLYDARREQRELFLYWPAQHPFFDQDGGRKIYFEGTYTTTFSGNPVTTPRYEYNQLMYRLSLDDPRLFLPAPVYRLKDGTYRMRDAVEAAHAWDQVAEVPFFALPLDRKREGAIEIGDLFTRCRLVRRTPHWAFSGRGTAMMRRSS